MEDQKLQALIRAFENYFKLNRGNIFFKPEIFSLLDEAHFEDVNDWATQHKIQSGVTSGLAKNFPELEIVHNGLQFIFDSKTGDLDIEIQAKFRKESFTGTFNLHKGVRNKP